MRIDTEAKESTRAHFSCIVLHCNYDSNTAIESRLCCRSADVTLKVTDCSCNNSSDAKFICKLWTLQRVNTIDAGVTRTNGYRMGSIALYNILRFVLPWCDSRTWVWRSRYHIHVGSEDIDVILKSWILVIWYGFQICNILINFKICKVLEVL